MTQSMTGFARNSVTTSQFAVIVELRSVNNRYLDLHFRCPDDLRAQEPKWRAVLAKRFERGKIEVSIRVNQTSDAHAITLDDSKLNELKRALADIQQNLPDAGYPDALAILQAPGVTRADEVSTSDLTGAAQQALSTAVEELADQRSTEGRKLADMVHSRVDSMRHLLAALREQLPLLREQQTLRLRTRLEQTGIEADAKRLEEELVYMAQRSDVDEEMDRLDAHLDAITTSLQSGKPCGRRLDFLMQELNREANTLSSKSTALTTTNTAVEFKVLIEQMREQIQNIE